MLQLVNCLQLSQVNFAILTFPPTLSFTFFLLLIVDKNWKKLAIVSVPPQKPRNKAHYKQNFFFQFDMGLRNSKYLAVGKIEHRSFIACARNKNHLHTRKNLPIDRISTTIFIPNHQNRWILWSRSCGIAGQHSNASNNCCWLIRGFSARIWNK